MACHFACVRSFTSAVLPGTGASWGRSSLEEIWRRSAWISAGHSGAASLWPLAPAAMSLACAATHSEGRTAPGYGALHHEILPPMGNTQDDVYNTQHQLIKQAPHCKACNYW